MDRSQLLDFQLSHFGTPASFHNDTNVVRTLPLVQNVPRGTLVQTVIVFHGEHYSHLRSSLALQLGQQLLDAVFFFERG